jgi:hypothetical protein
MSDNEQRQQRRLQRITNFLRQRQRQSTTQEPLSGETDAGTDDALPDPWEIYPQIDTLPDIDDEFMRYKVETETERTLREDFKTTVENAKDPAEKEQLRDLVQQQNKTISSLQSHPILAKFKQFFNREINLLPTMDVEQQVKHQELQNRKEYLKNLQKRNEQEMGMKKK